MAFVPATLDGRARVVIVVRNFLLIFYCRSIIEAFQAVKIVIKITENETQINKP